MDMRGNSEIGSRLRHTKASEFQPPSAALAASLLAIKALKASFQLAIII